MCAFQGLGHPLESIWQGMPCLKEDTEVPWLALRAGSSLGLMQECVNGGQVLLTLFSPLQQDACSDMAVLDWRVTRCWRPASQGAH